MFHTIEEAVEDLKKGKIIIVVDDENRENEGDFVVLGEHATPENINFMATVWARIDLHAYINAKASKTTCI